MRIPWCETAILWFLERLDSESFLHIADVPGDMRVWLERPEVEVLARKGKRGRHSTRKQIIKGEPVEVWKLVEELPEDAWNHIFLRDSERKEI